MALGQPVPGYPCTGTASCRGGTPFVSYHQAVDFPAPGGTPVVAVADGTIASMGWELPGLWGGGNEIRLAFYANAGAGAIGPKGQPVACEADYCHLESFAAGLAAGQQVRAGQTIGYVGKTSDAAHRILLGIPAPTGTHVHLILKIGGVARDVRQYFAGGPHADWRFGLKGGVTVTGSTASGPGGNPVPTAPMNADGSCPTGYVSGATIRKTFTDQGILGWLAVSSPVGIPGFSTSVNLDDHTCYDRSGYSQAAYAQAASVPQASGILDAVGGVVRNGLLLAGFLVLGLIGVYVLLKQSGGSAGAISVG